MMLTSPENGICKVKYEFICVKNVHLCCYSYCTMQGEQIHVICNLRNCSKYRWYAANKFNHILQNMQYVMPQR